MGHVWRDDGWCLTCQAEVNSCSWIREGIRVRGSVR